MSFISAYYDSYRSVLHAADEVMSFTLDELYQEFRHQNSFGLLMSLMSASFLLMPEDEEYEFTEIGEQPHNVSGDDKERRLDCICRNPYVRSRLLDMLDEMVEYGTLKIC